MRSLKCLPIRSSRPASIKAAMEFGLRLVLDTRNWVIGITDIYFGML